MVSGQTLYFKEHNNNGSFIGTKRTISQGLDDAKYQYPEKYYQLLKKLDMPIKRHKHPCSKYALWNMPEEFFIPLPCKQWSCPNCADDNKKALEKRLKISDMVNWHNMTHITITMAKPQEMKVTGKWIKDLLQYLKRGGSFDFIDYHGHKVKAQLPARINLKFFKMKEFQPERGLLRGEWVVHFHFLVNKNITKYDIIPIWNKITGGVCLY